MAPGPRRARRRRPLGNWRSLGASGLAILLGLLAWQVMAAEHVVASYSLPAPHAVWTEWWALSGRGILWHDVLASTLIDAAATEGAGRWTSLRHIELPLSTRTILAGVRMGLTLSMTGAIVSEFVAASAGLGYMMELGRSQYDAPLVFAAALTLVALAVLGYVVVGLLERVLIDWE